MSEIKFLNICVVSNPNTPLHVFIFKIINYLFIYFWLCESSLLCRLFSSCGKWGILSSCSAWASHCGDLLQNSVSIECRGFSSCSVWAQQLQLPGSRAWLRSCSMGLVGPWHVRSSQIRDQTHLLHWQEDSLPLSHERNHHVPIN